jgi:hypothetical protein
MLLFIVELGFNKVLHLTYSCFLYMKNTGMYNLERSQFSKYLQNSNTTTQEL